jgi:hypothetical protein
MSARLHWLPVAALVWGGCLLGFALHAHYYPHAHTVYVVYAPAARYWWEGQDMYVKGVDYFRYSPLVAVGFTPLALLPDEWGSPLWKVINVGLYGFALLTWARRCLPIDLTWNQRGLLLLLVLPTSLHSMYNGQANLLMLSAILLGMADAASDRWNGAAAWLALATLIKVYPLGIGLIVAILYPRRFAPRYVIALIFGLALPFATQAPSTVVGQYASWVKHLGDSTIIMRERLRSFDHLLNVYQFPISPLTFARLGVAAGFLVLVLCLLEARRTTDQRQLFTRVFLSFAVWTVLFGPATESCTYAAIAPAIAWSLIEAWTRPPGWLARGVLLISLLLMGPLVSDIFPASVRHFASTHASQPLGAMLLAGFLVAQTGISVWRDHCSRLRTSWPAFRYPWFARS